MHAALPPKRTESRLRATAYQGCRVAIGRRRVVIDGRGKAHEFFFETDPHPYPLYSPQAKAGSMYINSGTTKLWAKDGFVVADMTKRPAECV
jgi:hypothetical protein